MVPITNEPRRAALLQEVMAHPSVAIRGGVVARRDGRSSVTTVDA